VRGMAWVPRSLQNLRVFFCHFNRDQAWSNMAEVREDAPYRQVAAEREGDSDLCTACALYSVAAFMGGEIRAVMNRNSTGRPAGMGSLHKATNCIRPPGMGQSGSPLRSR
jgi:hypothetical protein